MNANTASSSSDASAGARWRPAPLWPHWCRIAQIANVAHPDGVVRIWDPSRRDWFWMGGSSSRELAAGEQVLHDVRTAWGRARQVAVPESWTMSWFRSQTDNVPKRIVRTLDEIAARLTRFEAGTKGTLPLWSPAVYPDDATRRCNEQVESVGMLVLDYDDGTQPDEAIGTWGAWAHIVYTTPSHTAEAPRFRVVLPLAVPVPASEWRRVWRWAEQCTGKTIDRACKDPSRMYWGHGGPEARIAYATRALDRPLLWVDLERLPPEPVRAPWKPLPRRESRASNLYEATEEAGRLLRTCPDTRRRAGQLAGGTLAEDHVRGVNCPRCGRPSVWWPFVPERVPLAMCTHRNSCDWTGPITEVLP